MTSESNEVKIFFFPFVGGGHMIPMIDAARTFAAHGVHTTILTPPSDAHVFHKAIERQNAQPGHYIQLQILNPPPGQSLSVDSADMSAPPFTDTSIFKAPLEILLQQHRPDCIIMDTFHRWASDVVDNLEIPRLIFNGSGCFPRCVGHCLQEYLPHEKVESDHEPFIIPGLSDRIEFTRSELSPFDRNPNPGFAERRKKVEMGSFGYVVNSFYELEPAYVDFYRKEMGKRAWLIGPVSLCNQNIEDQSSRGQKSTIDEHFCLNWLNSQKPNSVLYISFGSLAQLPSPQLTEIGYALEASNQPFIWVIRNSNSESRNEDTFLPEKFKESMIDSKRGLIVRGWAPQLLILAHEAVGGFVTHCGWNSMMEGVCAGVPMITWPLSAEQFNNEKLVTEVLRVGVQAGSKEWRHFDDDGRAVVRREKVVEAIRKVMCGGDEAANMKMRVEEYKEKARKAVEEGGSSYGDLEDLVKELRKSSRNNNQGCTETGTSTGKRKRSGTAKR